MGQTAITSIETFTSTGRSQEGLMMLDLIAISGWIIGVVSLIIAVYEYYEKKRIEKVVDEKKKSAFLENMKKTLSVFLPNFPVFGIDKTVKSVGGKYLLDYIDATNTEDPSNVLIVWEKAAVELGRTIQNYAQQKNSTIPDGLAEFIAFYFLSHYSKEISHDYLAKIAKQGNIGESFARYYFAISRSPRNLTNLIKDFNSCSSEQVQNILAALRGEEFKRVVELFANQKWNRRIIERLREYVGVREVSYNSLVNKILETSLAPRLFLVFKNEGVEPQLEEEDTSARPVTSKLRQLRSSEKAELISPMTSIYFLKDNSAMEELLKALPGGIENNYVLFAGEVDPLSVSVRTSDRLQGHPARLYMNLQKFRDLKDIYETIILKLGLKPSEIIETADIGFLIEPKSDKLSESLRKHSKSILKELSQYSKRTYSILTDLRNMDENDVGFLGHLIAQKCNLRQSEGRELAKQILGDSQELYDSIYRPLDAA
jgi:hypothetical protein